MITKYIGDEIRKKRKCLGITQDELARRSCIPYTTLTKIELNVIKKPTIQTVIKISRGLNISIDTLIEELNIE